MFPTQINEKIEEYDKVEKELSKLEKAFPQDMKKSILQYAIQGKLVEQNHNDETVSILLKRIKDKKEQLIKEKKIKKEKALPEISVKEKPTKTDTYFVRTCEGCADIAFYDKGTDQWHAGKTTDGTPNYYMGIP